MHGHSSRSIGDMVKRTPGAVRTVTFSEARGEKNVDMAIEMSSVAIRICWESIIEQNPGLPREELLRIFKQRVGVRHISTEDEGR